MIRLVFCLIMLLSYAVQAYSQCKELENDSNSDPEILFLYAGTSQSGVTIKSADKQVKSFINEGYVDAVKNIISHSGCSLGKYDFNLGPDPSKEAGEGYLEFTLSDELQKSYESIDVYANQYEKKNVSTGVVTKYPAELSVNESDPYPITHEPNVEGGYTKNVGSKNYGLYRYTLANPDVPLTTVKLQSTGRIVLKQLNFNLKQETQSIDALEADENAQEEYFDLDGRKVDPDNLRSGIYIVKKGHTVTKIIVRN